MVLVEGLEIDWLGHDAFRVRASGKTICFDPFRLKGNQPKADLVFISHDHFDHCSVEDIAKVKGPNTVIVAPENCTEKLEGVTPVIPGDDIDLDGIRVQAVHAYNVNKFRSPGEPFHPKGFGVGYIVAIAGKRLYHGGDTDAIPEMKEFKKIDVALIPVSGTYVMTPEEAVRAAELLKPKIAIPMHYGSIVGSEKDARDFEKRYSGKTVVLKPVQ